MTYNTNLFYWATSELSQDAFICWLLSWADRSNAAKNPAMHATGLTFLNALLQHSNQPPVSGTTVRVKKQFYSIDVIAEVGENLVLLIEDKTDTCEHGDQLKRYHAVLQEHYPQRAVLPIFCKTGNQSNYKKAEQSGYSLFLRHDFLSVLRKITADGLENNIIDDFLSSLECREEKTQSFLTLPVAQWPSQAWEGFFLALQHVFPDLRWGYVANPRGGFMGAWWHYGAWSGWETYLQIEQESLVLRLGCWHTKHPPAVCASVRDRWLKTLEATSRQTGITIQRPARRGNGRSMAAACVGTGPDWIKLDQKGLLDFNATVAFLREVMTMLDLARSDLTHAHA
ncbi:PD-(D/E)XK nuclease family protein [Komagataeibacter xylinus]|uniref:PD-(D/E)XK nuclease family protein n=1 Tax=Komagataeibacter xylinus TaxID=28448 RepID=UPI00103076E6|nr:PD-(D/E)XK nuclease family protein [Komagataeibacter xylinus]